jgi:hypothetical protein
VAATPQRISNRPSEFDPELWKPNTGKDTARYLIDPGTVKAVGQHSPGQLRHARPYIANGTKFFVFPIGVEGFRRSGTAQLGLHRYIGDNTVDGKTMHREEARIELTGTFPGITAQANMVECINILRSIPPDIGLVLYAPGVFNRQQYVLAENWDFSHSEDDRTHSIAYTITFVRIGEGRKVNDPKGKPPPPQPGVKKTPRGKPMRIFVIKDGVRTFRGIAKVKYGNANKWQQIVKLNQPQLTKWMKGNDPKLKVPSHKYPTYRWPIGTKFRF